ncbi:MAG: hemerythrin domain-containing protein [Candidatus Electrothrix sp.]
MKLQWDQQKYTTGFTHIDEQHSELFDGVNGLMLFLKQSSPKKDLENKQKIIEMLQFLGEYAQKHFQDEEKVFEKYDHPMKDANKEEHQLFLEKYVHYQKKLQIKLQQERLTRGVLIQIHIFLQSWLVKHILKVDTSLRDCAEKAAEQQTIEHNSTISKGAFSRFLAFFALNN